MERLVLISERPLSAHPQVIHEIEQLPGISVTSFSPSFIDVEVTMPKSVTALRTLASSRGLAVAEVPEVQLMEPMSPFQAMRPAPSVLVPERAGRRRA